MHVQYEIIPSSGFSSVQNEDATAYTDTDMIFLSASTS